MRVLARTAFLALSLCASAQAFERESLSLTIYNEDLTLVRDVRRFDWPGGEAALSLPGVASQIRPESVQVKSLLPGSDFEVLEQNFEGDWLSQAKLLRSFVGKELTILTRDVQGKTQRIAATLLAAPEGNPLNAVWRIEGEVRTGLPADAQLVFPPDSVKRTEPSLSIRARSAKAGQQRAEWLYLTGGLSWKADVVAELDAAEKQLDWQSWATLSNRTETDFPQASIDLVAGQVHQAAPPMPMMMRAAKMEMAAGAADIRAQAMGDYQRFALPQKINLAAQQMRQVRLFNARVKVRKVLRFEPQGVHHWQSEEGFGAAFDFAQQQRHAQSILEFTNDERAGLGRFLPGGTVRVYQREGEGARFLGEDNIAHTAAGERVQLKLGMASEISAERKQTRYQKLGAQSVESAYAMTIRNASARAAAVQVQEAFAGVWRMIESSHEAERADAQRAVWNLSVPARSSVTLTWRAQLSQQ